MASACLRERERRDQTADPGQDKSTGINCYHVVPPQPLSPKAEAEMRRARATSRIDEEDLQYILEEMCEGEKEGGLGASLGGLVDSQSRRTSSSSSIAEQRSKEGESKVLLSPPVKVRLGWCGVMNLEQQYSKSLHLVQEMCLQRMPRLFISSLFCHRGNLKVKQLLEKKPAKCCSLKEDSQNV